MGLAQQVQLFHLSWNKHFGFLIISRVSKVRVGPGFHSPVCPGRAGVGHHPLWLFSPAFFTRMPGGHLFQMEQPDLNERYASCQGEYVG